MHRRSPDLLGSGGGGGVERKVVLGTRLWYRLLGMRPGGGFVQFSIQREKGNGRTYGRSNELVVKVSFRSLKKRCISVY